MSAWIDDELAAARGELARTDSKCGVLAAVATGAAAFTVTQTGHGPVAVRLVLAVAGVVFAAAVLLLLAVLRPRFGSGGWCRYAGLAVDQVALLDDFGSVDVVDGAGQVDHTECVQDFAAEDLVVLSRILRVKYWRLRLAVDLASAGVVLLGAGIVAGVIA